VVKSDGSIWFTDPPFGIAGYYQGERAPQELPHHIYRIVSCPRFLWTPYCSEKLEDRQHGR